jgi:signal transduction histidine kinase
MSNERDEARQASRLLAAVQPLVPLVGPSVAVRLLPELIREVTASRSASVAVLCPDGVGIDRLLEAEHATRAHADLAAEVLCAAIPHQVAGEGLFAGRAVLPDGERCEFLFVPLMVDDRRAGLACTVKDGGGSYSAVDRKRLEVLAPWAGAMLDAEPSAGETHPHDERRRGEMAATERERRRWARNLHDETLQSLGVVRFGLAAALEAPGSGDRQAMTLAVASLGDQIENLRALIDDLRPSVLDELGLGPALLSLIERVRRLSPARVDVRIALGDEDERLPAEVELVAYRLVQEALNNIVKHARATTVRLAVARRSEHLELLVADDGEGFDVAASPKGVGLSGMGERVALAHGKREVRSRVGTGTTVEIQIPF